MLYVRERAKQRKSILFFVNFLSLFTNPEMQECEMKECGLLRRMNSRIIGNDNEIKDEERMKKIVVDAVVLLRWCDA